MRSLAWAMDTPAFIPLDGGCACGQVRFRLLREPLFVHCCHCTRCQRETGGPFAHHAVIEHSALALLQGEPESVQVPSDSGQAHHVHHCPQCRSVLWNAWGQPRRAVSRYVRVGALDEPARCPPQAHIYVRSRQPWVWLDEGVPAHKAYYQAERTWPATSLERWRAAREQLSAGPG